METTVLRTHVESLFSVRMGKPLDMWVFDRRAAGASWRAVERELYAHTGGDVAVSSVTLAKWYQQEDAA